jgi:aerobic carbon-monoxide dehydrogenase medium subunit
LKPPAFEYFAPTQLSEAVQLFGQCENARLLAGGQSLMAMLNMRFLFPDQLIDLNGVGELDHIHEVNGEIVIGAMTRQRTLQRSEVIASHLPVIPKALRYVGHIQTRNRGTLGGSLCQLDPSAELPALAMAYDAVVEAIGPNGQRSIPFAEFPAFFMTPSLEPNEILTAVRFKPWPGRVGYGFQEFSRRHGDFAIGGAISMLSIDTHSTIDRAAVTLFGIAHAPVRASEAEALLTGQRPSATLFQRAGELCLDLATLDDTYGSASYRGHVAAAMVERALAESQADLGIHGA